MEQLELAGILMHPYVIDTNERERVLLFLALLSIGFAWAFNWLLTQAHLTVPWYMEAPSVFGIYGLLLAGFNQYAWRFTLLRAIQLVKTPYLGGKWNGHLVSSYHNHEKSQPVDVTIQQTWTRVCIEFDTGPEGSHSHSDLAGILIEHAGGPVLSYNYLNEPRSSTKTMHMHRGTAILNIRHNFLEGQYFSGRDRMNYGSIRLNRMSDG